MFISRAPLRISFFGGSTDYKDFYSRVGGFVVGACINKYSYTGLRYRPKFLDKKNHISYSSQDIVSTFEEIKNPLIREILKFYKIDKHIDLVSFNDVPSRTGLGGSSSFSVSLIHSIYKLLNKTIIRDDIIKEAIKIEREILKDSGGIQDQIWAGYGGLNSIQILKDGEFLVKPLPVTKDFIKELQKSICLIYTNSQRNEKKIANSHIGVDKTAILQIAKEGYKAFYDQNIEQIGFLIKNSWNEKKKISSLIETEYSNNIINDCLKLGCYGAKLLGSGGCGFVCIIGNPQVINKIKSIYKNNVLDVEFEFTGVSQCM